MKFYTSDTHFYHANVIKYERRPFANVDEMNESIIENWNRKVSKNDEVYHLGDFAFAKGHEANSILERLNGNIFFVSGNHDKHLLKDKTFNKSRFTWIKDYASITDSGVKVILFHYPIAVWDCQFHGSIHLYGHVHSHTETQHRILNSIEGAYHVGVDEWNYEPVTLHEILAKQRSQIHPLPTLRDGVVHVSDETIKRVTDKATSSKAEARKYLKSIGVVFNKDGTVEVKPWPLDKP